jgi:hypothetical protein
VEALCQLCLREIKGDSLLSNLGAYMERSDAMIHAVIQRWRAALLACDWDIRLCPPEAGEARIQKSESRRNPGIRYWLKNKRLSSARHMTG